MCFRVCLRLKAAPSQRKSLPPPINLLITVISDSFHHYRFHTTHCLPLYTTIPGENFTQTHTHTRTHTQEHTEAWPLITHSSTSTPAVCHPSLCHWGEKWRKKNGTEEKMGRGERERKNCRDKGRSDPVCVFTLSWASLNPLRAQTDTHTQMEQDM